jgi:hypothetical protein
MRSLLAALVAVVTIIVATIGLSAVNDIRYSRQWESTPTSSPQEMSDQCWDQVGDPPYKRWQYRGWSKYCIHGA